MKNYFLILFLATLLSLSFQQVAKSEIQFQVGPTGDFICKADDYGIAHLYRVSGSTNKELSIRNKIKLWKNKKRQIRIVVQLNKRSDNKQQQLIKSLRLQVSTLKSQIIAAEDCLKLNNMAAACAAFQEEPDTSGLIALPVIDGASCQGLNSPVVEVLLYDSNNFFAGSCTGTVLNENTVITAGHCALAGRSGVAYVDIQTTAGNVYTTNQIFAHPNYLDGSGESQNHDIAIIRTNEKINTAAMELLTTNDLVIGEVMAMAGFGVDENLSDGELKAGFATLDYFNNESITIRFLPGSGSNSCYGDSGGPLAVYRADKWKLVGSTSNGSNGTCGVNNKEDYSNWANVSSASNLAFIASIAPELFQ